MSRTFDQQTVITDSDIEEEEVTREDQLTQDLALAWEVAIDEYVQQEAEQRALPSGTVNVELTVNEVVYDLLEAFQDCLQGGW